MPFRSDKDLKIIKNLMKDNKLKPVIDKIYKMEKIQAHRYVEKGNKRGNII